MIRRPRTPPLFPTPRLSGSAAARGQPRRGATRAGPGAGRSSKDARVVEGAPDAGAAADPAAAERHGILARRSDHQRCEDRKSTRLNSSHLVISYAVFCLKKK